MVEGANGAEELSELRISESLVDRPRRMQEVLNGISFHGYTRKRVPL